MHVLTIAGRILAVICGSVFVYAALFLYEDEQGRIQSALEDLWIKISDLQQAAISQPAAFMRQVAHYTESAFNRLFGTRLISAWSASVSACFSTASICLMIIYQAYRNDRMVDAMYASRPHGVIILNTRFSDEYGPFFLPSIAAILLFFLMLGFFPAFANNSRRLKAWFSCVVLAVIAADLGIFRWEYYGWREFFIQRYTGHGGGHVSILWENLRFRPTPDLIANRTFIGLMLTAFLLGIVIGIASDVIFIAITRRILRWASEVRSFLRILVIVGVNCLLGLILAFGPAVLGYGISSLIFGFDGFGEPFPGTILSRAAIVEGLQQAGYVASLSNVVTAFSAFAFVLLAFAALVHKPFWPLLARFVYALQRIGIAGHSKVLGSLGLALLGIGLGFVPNWVKAMMEGLGH